MTHSELSGTGLWAVGVNGPRVLCLTPASRPPHHCPHLTSPPPAAPHLTFPPPAAPTSRPPAPHLTTPPPLPPTVVCYQANRDELRRRIIQWLEAEIIPDGWFSKGSNYSEILDKYFKVLSAGVNQPRSVLEKGRLPLPLLWLSGDPKCALITGSSYGAVKVA